VSDLPTAANVVVIGSGIVGNSVVAHLAELGWRDIVQLDKGPLPNPGGSTGHASNFIFPVDHNREMAALTLDSQRQYEAMGVNTFCGGIEIARKPERLEEFRRRMTSATAWGIEAELLTPEAVAGHVPFIDTDIVLGGFYTPSVSVVDSLRAGTIFRERAMELGALTTVAGVEVLDIEVENGRVTGVVTDQGRIPAQYVVIACGVWSPRIAAMAGATIPLTPAVHQMIDVGPIPELEATGNEIGFPIVRDMDTFCYERQTGGSMEVGSYAHRPIFHYADDIPSIQASRLSPTELPFTADDFDQQLEEALELMPDILSTAEMKYAINGLLSLTPDGFPLLGETTEVRNLWSAAAVWIKEGPGVGRMIAEWMTHGASEIDPHHSDIARFYPYARNDHHIRARCAEHFNKTYGIVHPGEQWESNRGVRLSPYYERERALGAVFFETAGWERPFWYESNAPLLQKYSDDALMPRTAEWDSRWWSPIINAEHLALRDGAGLVDLTAFVILDVVGPGALEALNATVMRQLDVAVGKVIYTPVLSPNGGFKSDLTIMRLGKDHFRIVTGGAHGMADKKWFVDHLPTDGSAQLTDLTSAYTTLGIWGPNARDIVASVTSTDMSHEGFPFGTCRTIEIGPVQVLASRISYVGDLGWELYVPMEQGGALWDVLWAAGETRGLVPVGIGVYGTTGRIEKGYRAFGTELETEYNVVEAGMAPPKIKAQEFVGKEAHLRHRDEEPAALLCTLTVDDATSSRGVKRYMLGKEPILTQEGQPITDRKGRRSFVTSAGSGPSIGKHILLTYLPPQHAVEGNKLLVEYLGEQYPVTVDIVGATPPFDPKNERILS
jgi:heterotetrameric sarcosine oxidase gamma subunit